MLECLSLLPFIKVKEPGHKPPSGGIVVVIVRKITARPGSLLSSQRVFRFPFLLTESLLFSFTLPFPVSKLVSFGAFNSCHIV